MFVVNYANKWDMKLNVTERKVNQPLLNIKLTINPFKFLHLNIWSIDLNLILT